VSALLAVPEILDRARALGAIIGIDAKRFDRYAKLNDDAYPFLEVNDAYHYVIRERGSESRRRTTRDLDELLYWILEDRTAELASSYAVHHKVAGQEFRRPMFRHQLELLAKISPDMQARGAKRIADVLAKNPFEDDGPKEP
jgi:hypothetical protein